MNAWPYPAANGYCRHGQPVCTGAPDRGVGGCSPGEYHYCEHGIDTRLQTSDGEPRCSYCRGVTARKRNGEYGQRRKYPIVAPANNTDDTRTDLQLGQEGS